MIRIARIWLYVLVLICAISLFISIFWFVRPPHRQAVSEQTQAEYMLKDYNGRLAVYQPGGDSPIKIYEVYTYLLPETDTESLRAGILVNNEQELDRLLEDFGV